MATFLSLVNDVERESGVIASTQRLATVSGAAGIQEKIVQWTAQAWQDIQRMRPDWTFMRKTFTSALVVGTSRYAATDFSITDFGKWMPEVDGLSPYKIHVSALGLTDQTRLRVLPYRNWQAMYDISTTDNERPGVVSFDWANQLCVGPPPDVAYVIKGEYRRAVEILAADATEPDMPDDHHRAIVWLALSYFAAHDEAPAQQAEALAQFRRIYGAMVRECVEEIEA